MTPEPENFIPWEQIAPLIEDGMTLRDLARRIVASAGLDAPRYTLLTTKGPQMPTATLAEVLRRGVWIVKADSAEARHTRLVANYRLADHRFHVADLPRTVLPGLRRRESYDEDVR